MFALGYPPNFKYVKVKDLEEALENLRDGVKPLAGGQSLIPMLKLRVVKFDSLMDINDLDLRYVTREKDVVRIGALTTHNDVSKIWFLRHVAMNIADLQVRNKGTIGGSLANADPSANYYPALMVLDAKVKLKSKKGERVVKVSELYNSPYSANIREEELITEVIVPEPKEFTFKVFKKGGASYPSVIVAISIIGEKARIGIGGVFERPILYEGEVDEKLPDEVFSSVDLTPLSDHVSGEAKIRIAKNFIREMLTKRDLRKGQDIPLDRLINWKSGFSISAESKVNVKLKVNDMEIEDSVEPRTLLLDVLRRNGFKEVKRGCDEGKCGACTVIINGRAVKSCLTLAIQAVGHDVRTVKGLNIEHIKDSFVKNFAMQCGYCTHGFLMVTYDYLNNVDPKANDETLKYSVKNICRCTGYVNIVKAIKEAATK